LAHTPQALAGFTFSLEVFKFYFGLMQAAESASGQGLAPEQETRPEPSLGGKLLWAGELDSAGRAMAVAGNIAGAATLTATADVDAQKQTIRDGVVDFLVTSLDEALRILKNEIRKRQTVAVCVGAAPELIEREMLERGVQPDLFRGGVIVASERPTAQRESADLDRMEQEHQALVIWRVDTSPALWLPKLDAIALDCLEAGDRIERRWIRLVPRYVGRSGHGVHLIVGNREFAASFVERVREQVRLGGIAFQGQIQVSHADGNEEYNFPARPSNEGD
jgi:hypothetical protein